jgi:branched-chain amino acid transport system ATP-binding protein
MRAFARCIWASAVVTEPLVAIKDVRAGYGDAVVLDGISLELADNASLAVLGRNGVGKSTLVLTLMGFTRVHKGRIFWRGRDVTAMPPHRRASLGIGWVAQEREIFPSLTVEENLSVGARPGRWTLASVYALFPRLAERRGHMGNQLSGGEQQMLAIARALMTNPALLALDEPLEGLAPIIVEELAAALKQLEGVAMLLVEQHIELALSLTEQAIVIERGRIVHRALSRDLPSDAATLERLVGLRVS